jgi:hypothetical protein
VIRSRGRAEIEHSAQLSLTLKTTSRKIGAAYYGASPIVGDEQGEFGMKNRTRAGISLAVAKARGFARNRISIANDEHRRDGTFAEVGDNRIFEPSSVE